MAGTSCHITATTTSPTRMYAPAMNGTTRPTVRPRRCMPPNTITQNSTAIPRPTHSGSQPHASVVAAVTALAWICGPVKTVANTVAAA